MTSHITTHVLDAVQGSPASGIRIALFHVSGERAVELAAGVTDSDGRLRDLGPEKLEPGVYRLVFATGDYFAEQGKSTFYPQVTIDFYVEQGQDHYHVPILLSPFAFSTYRGS